MFFNTLSSREPYLPFPNVMSLLDLKEVVETAPPDTSVRFLDGTNGELAQAWKILWEFGTVINFAAVSGHLISTQTFLGTMASVLYRLLNMHFEADSSSEALRLGLLAFSSSVFLQWNQLGMPYLQFASAFRDCLARQKSPRRSSQLLLWLLMIGAVSVFEAADDVWLKPLLFANIKLHGIDSWSEMQDRLKSFLWIGLIHDRPGKAIFDSITGHLQRNTVCR